MRAPKSQYFLKHRYAFAWVHQNTILFMITVLDHEK